ncbi:MBL fold metallo-hydrolase [Lacrimispora sp.]|uniref:MBL fold metallo-hydrolase n=1 Tax=Lacrimispora sp. TaxID=2719234 RepID=UPI00289BA899|nr:MBL fold metallo-hydrolase [Lacrimispora sp.]
MELHFLGSGSAFYPQYKNTSAYFELNNDLYLIDCGETVFETLLSLVDLEQYMEIYVVITHLHADHVGSLSSLISYTYCMLDKKQVTVIHPKPTIVQLLSLMGIGREFYRYKEAYDGSSVEFEPIQVQHVDNMECFGYVIKVNGETIYYSGDSSHLPQRILEDFRKGEIETIYHDTSTHNSDYATHCYYGKLEAWIPHEMRRRVFCMHLDSDCKDLLEGKGFSVVNVDGDSYAEPG